MTLPVLSREREAERYRCMVASVSMVERSWIFGYLIVEENYRLGMVVLIFAEYN